MQQQINALFIARRFPPSVGGMERFAFDLYTSLKGQTERIDKVTWGGSNKWLPLVMPWLFLKALRMIIIKRDYDVLHIQDALLSPIGWLLHIMSNKPFVVVAHGLDVTYANKLYQLVVPKFLKRASAVISISTATTKEVTDRGVDASRAYTIPLGITDDTAGTQPDRVRLEAVLGLADLADKTLLLTVGRLVKRKGVAWFLRNVFPAISSEHPEVVYLVAGEGSERNNIESAIEEKHLQKRVYLLGEVEEEIKLLLYKSCDIFIMPNIKVPGDMEGFGRVAHEAAVAGMPVVASNLEGIADALQEGKNGVLIKPGDTVMYTEQISELLESSTERRKHGNAAREYTLENFGWEQVAHQYVRVYRELLRK